MSDIQKFVVELEGKHNLGLLGSEKLSFTIESTKTNILIKDSTGKTLISFAPFFDGGSVWLNDFSSIILDVEHWSEDDNGKFVCKYKETLENTSSSGISRWRDDSVKLQKIRDARKILEEVE